MSKNTKIRLIVAALLILAGCIIFGGVMKVLNWDFTKLSTVKYETNEHTVGEEFKNIIIRAKTADVEFVPSESGEASVVCYEAENQHHDVTVENGTLAIEIRDCRKWYEYIGINFTSPKITVYLPQGKYGTLSAKTSTGRFDIPNEFSFESIDIAGNTGNIVCRASATGLIKIKNSTGGIDLENISAGRLEIKLSTGKVSLTDIRCENDISVEVSTGKAELAAITCKNVISDGDTGSILLKNVIADEKLSVERSTGNVKFDRCDAAEIYIETDTGDVSGSLLTSKVFITETDTGRVDVPKSVEGGRCEISTDTGDINIEISS